MAVDCNCHYKQLLPGLYWCFWRSFFGQKLCRHRCLPAATLKNPFTLDKSCAGTDAYQQPLWRIPSLWTKAVQAPMPTSSHSEESLHSGQKLCRHRCLSAATLKNPFTLDKSCAGTDAYQQPLWRIPSLWTKAAQAPLPISSHSEESLHSWERKHTRKDFSLL